MKTTLILISLVSYLHAETPEKIPSLQKALKLNPKQAEEAAKKPIDENNIFQGSNFDPSFLLDVDDDYSFKDPLTDPAAAKEKLEHPELSSQISADVLGIPQIGAPLQPAPAATPATPTDTPQVVDQNTANTAAAIVFGPTPTEKTTPVGNTPILQPPNLAPMMAGINSFGAAAQKIPLPSSTPAQPIIGISDVAVLLSNNQFFPSRIRIKEGTQTRLIFATLNKKPAALIIEKLQVQKWIAREEKVEITREISSSKVTEVTISPVRGSYSFYDAISGASGEIVVE